MKVILYMAVSVDGFIAKKNDDTSWISEKEWNSYSSFIQKAGNLIVGHRTYNILTKQPEFSELKEVKLVVVSHESFPTLATNHLVASSPQEALNLITDFSEVVIAGGGELNGSFLEENLIDEIYLDIEPTVLGKGIKLFGSFNSNVSLELFETKKITANEIQLHYKILK